MAPADNTRHLVAAAQRRRTDTLDRARKTLHELGETGQRHTVTAIAARGGLPRLALRPGRATRRHPTTHHRSDRAGTSRRPDRTRNRGLAAAATHPRPPAHPRTRHREPPVARPGRPTARPIARRPHRQHPRRRHCQRRNTPAHAAKRPNRPKITLTRRSSLFSAQPAVLVEHLRRGPVVPLVMVGLVLADPVPQGLRVHVQLPRQLRDHRLRIRLPIQPHRALTQLHRVLPRRCH